MFRSTILVLECSAKSHKTLRACKHRLVEFASATCAPSSSLCNTFLNIFPISRKLIIQHFFGIISLLLLLLDLNLLIDLHFRAFKFLLCFMKSSFHEALGFLFFTVQVSFLEHLMHGLLFGAWFLPFIFVSAIFSLFGIIFIRHFVKPLDLRWVHQLVQLSLVVFLPVHLLSRVIVLDCLCI